MSEFRTRLVMSPAHNNKDDGVWILDEPLIYDSDIAGRSFAVPKGFETDLASVPRLPVAYMLFGGTSNEASVVHDYCYKSKIVSREMADNVLFEASRLTGVPAWRRYPIWWAVRMFGGACWGS